MKKDKPKSLAHVRQDYDTKDLKALSDRLQQRAFSWQHEDYFLLQRVLPIMVELKEQYLAEKLDLPVLGLLGDHIKAEAKIVWQDDAFCLFASTGEDLAYGKTIGDLLVSLIMREC